MRTIPFFGRVGRILAENQRAETLKFELVTPVNSVEHPTAIASANCHLDHFGEPFGIVTADGAVAHSCCFGFGLDRITLALLRTHGVRPEDWPNGGTGPALAVSPGTRSQLLEVDRASYRPHPLHAGERTWTETNCYVDLWIELLHALGLDPLAAAAFTLSTDFEGDQWTFFKFPAEDLRALFGLEVAEFNVWRPTLDHAEEQLELGRLFIMDADAWFLPDTQGVSYRIAHVKSAMVPNMIDRDARRLGYFHNAGYFELEGDDFDGVFRQGSYEDPTVLPPYVETVRLDRMRHDPDALVAGAVALTRAHLARRPVDDPMLRLEQRLDERRGMAAQRGH